MAHVLTTESRQHCTWLCCQSTYFEREKHCLLRYEGDQQRFEVEQVVGDDSYKRLTEGTPVTVSYVSTHPNIARLAGRYKDDARRNSLIFFFIVYIVGFAFIVLFVLTNAVGTSVRVH